MRAQIGYSANDSATQLTRSLAGIQFLGFAAVLASSVGAFEGADALSVMLMDSASDKTLLPTARQLKDLLNVMDHRLNRSGFADMWVGYQILLSGGLRASSDQGRYELLDSVDLMQIPKSDGISNLVKAFGQLNRLGDATAITIRAASCAAWVMAFTRWCLGVPPTTVLPNGLRLLDQPASRITLFIDKDLRADVLEISVQRSIGSPADLLKSQPVGSTFHGMIAVECFGRRRCHAMGGKELMAYRAICEALPYALKQSRELLQIFDPRVDPRIPSLDKTTETADKAAKKQAKKKVEDMAARKDAIERERVAPYHTQPFPDDSTIASILTRILNSETHQYLQRLDDGQTISDLPIVREYLKSCLCGRCQNKSASSSACLEGRFFLEVSLYTADILTLSLFENPEALLVSLHHIEARRFGSLAAAVRNVLQSGKPTSCTVNVILIGARSLVGHKDLGEHESWVISSYKGQAVYPRVYETGDICQPGYLVLCWAPGLLFFDGDVYNRGIQLTNQSKGYVTDTLSMQPTPPVTKPLNLFPKIKTEWKVVRRDGYLEVYPACGSDTGPVACILDNLTRALILRGCPHDPASPLENPDLLSKYRSPKIAGRLSVTEGKIGVVAVAGDAGLRMFALSDALLSWPENAFVIRDNACLQCCLDLCRRAGYGHVIC